MKRWMTVLVVWAACWTNGAAWAGDLPWTNIEKIPDSLINTADGWTAARVNDTGFISYRCAADDFVLTETTKIDRISFFAAAIGSPIVIGGDWYVYEGGGTVPGKLIAYGKDLPLKQEDTGWVNPNFGPIIRSTLEMGGLELPAGHYYIAFRSIMSCPGGECPGKYGVLTTRWANGQNRALWNFGVLPDGQVTDQWVLMEVFNGVKDQEWAFILEGGAGTDCDAIRKLKVTCKGGKLVAKVKSGLPSGTLLTIDNEGDRKEMEIGKGGMGKVKYKKQTGVHQVFIVECPKISKTANCD